MKTFLQYSLVVVSILITVAVLLQNQSSGIGMAFGGESGFYRTKRGIEKFLFGATIALAVAFVACLLGLLTIK